MAGRHLDAKGRDIGVAIDASHLTYTPTGTIASTNVQDAVAEVATDEAAVDKSIRNLQFFLGDSST